MIRILHIYYQYVIKIIFIFINVALGNRLFLFFRLNQYIYIYLAHNKFNFHIKNFTSHLLNAMFLMVII